MNKYFIVFGCILLLIFVGLSGCEENSENGDNNENGFLDTRFFGTWISEENEGIYTFSSDGAFSFSAPEEEYTGTYEVKDEKLWFTYTSPLELEGEIEGFNYSFSGNDTIFTISPIDYPEFEIAFLKQ